MPALEYWEELRSGDTGQVILAVDGLPGAEFPSGFCDLAPLLDTPHALWRALPVTASGPSPNDEGPDGEGLKGEGLDAYVRPWIAGVVATGLRVHTVLGSRVGGIYAGVIARALARHQDAGPELLLFDPELIDAGSIIDEFHRVLSQLSTPLAYDELGTLELKAATAADAAFDDVEALAADLRGLLAGVPGVEEAELALAARRFDALTRAEPVDVLPLWSTRTALCSSSPDRGLARARSALLLPEAGFVREEIVFSDDHTAVFKSTQVARAASDLLHSYGV
ncbi:hypothetical protein AB0J38_33580 [Streptomyces sp. NPDC050095]|uniref:hypothetical protein n=1 Tax=unclassified Streptomyces TaxID=2593676 RepID=UPI003432A716